MGGTEVIDLKNMLVRIYLIRHGETERLVSGQHARHPYIPLTARAPKW